MDYFIYDVQVVFNMFFFQNWGVKIRILMTKQISISYISFFIALTHWIHLLLPWFIVANSFKSPFSLNKQSCFRLVLCSFWDCDTYTLCLTSSGPWRVHPDWKKCEDQAKRKDLQSERGLRQILPLLRQRVLEAQEVPWGESITK